MYFYYIKTKKIFVKYEILILNSKAIVAPPFVVLNKLFTHLFEGPFALLTTDGKSVPSSSFSSSLVSLSSSSLKFVSGVSKA